MGQVSSSYLCQQAQQARRLGLGLEAQAHKPGAPEDVDQVNDVDNIAAESDPRTRRDLNWPLISTLLTLTKPFTCNQHDIPTKLDLSPLISGFNDLLLRTWMKTGSTSTPNSLDWGMVLRWFEMDAAKDERRIRYILSEVLIRYAQGSDGAEGERDLERRQARYVLHKWALAQRGSDWFFENYDLDANIDNTTYRAVQGIRLGDKFEVFEELPEVTLNAMIEEVDWKSVRDFIHTHLMGYHLVQSNSQGGN
ncbi:hypothetical protein H2203_000974 [Taxawa tesnikishii (nom. ined.)]|nr:hypothetical protein H2203_000974 [Dothideales sp. JES 119]